MSSDYLSQYYDHILADRHGTELYYQFIKPYLQYPLLELACGTGDLLSLLSVADEHCVGIDINPSMLTLAYDKSKHFKLYRSDMRNFELYEPFKTIICVGDSLNYLNHEDLIRTLNQMDKHLSPKGKVIIDLHHPSRLQEFEEPFIEEGIVSPSLFYQWTIASSDNSLIHSFHFFDDYGNLLEDQTIIQYVHLAHPVIKWFHQHDYHVEYNQDFGLPVKSKGEKIFIIASKGEAIK